MKLTELYPSTGYYSSVLVVYQRQSLVVIGS